MDGWMEAREGVKDGRNGWIDAWMNDGFYKSAQYSRNIMQATNANHICNSKLYSSHSSKCK